MEGSKSQALTFQARASITTELCEAAILWRTLPAGARYLSDNWRTGVGWRTRTEHPRPPGWCFSNNRRSCFTNG